MDNVGNQPSVPPICVNHGGLNATRHGPAAGKSAPEAFRLPFGSSRIGARHPFPPLQTHFVHTLLELPAVEHALMNAQIPGHGRNVAPFDGEADGSALELLRKGTTRLQFWLRLRSDLCHCDTSCFAGYRFGRVAVSSGSEYSDSFVRQGKQARDDCATATSTRHNVDDSNATETITFRR